MLEQQGAWRKWTGDTRIILSTKKQGSGEAYEIQMLDAKPAIASLMMQRKLLLPIRHGARFRRNAGR